MSENKLMLPISIIVGGALIAGAVFITNRGNSDADVVIDPEPSREIDVRPVSEEDHIRGNPNAQIVVIEFSDLECPFCKQFHETMSRVMDIYGIDGRVSWVYRHFPLVQLHSQADDEAEATECVAELAGNDAFWEYVDVIFEITPSNNDFDLDLLPELATTLGIDRADFDECVESGRHAAAVQADFADARAAGGEGTPYSIIITRTGQIVPLSGAQSYDNMKATIDTLLGG